MAIYAIGDIQGCYSSLRRLLDLIKFDETQDRLWLVGDLVNRGPESLEVLRFVKQAGDAVLTVLGNHDLHLLMVDAGVARCRKGDTLQSILDAPDRDELLFWLRHQRLFYDEGGYALVHAGLLPDWSISQAAQLAREVETALRDDNYRNTFAQLYGNEPDCWCDDLTGAARLRVIINAMTRMRVCSVDGHMNFSFKGATAHIPAGFLPWFDVPQRTSRDKMIICGHWSALGLHMGANVAALDSGCVWQGCLSAMRLEDRQVFQLRCDKPAVINTG